jgi:hypothetical protein
MDAPVVERRRERFIHEPVLVDERETVEATAHDRDVEVIAAAGAIDHGELARVRERTPQEMLEPTAHSTDHTSR